jgi:HEAT repeat protein
MQPTFGVSCNRFRPGATALFLASALLLVTGCQSARRDVGYSPTETLTEVRPPVEKVQPLDPALREAARKELAEGAKSQDAIVRVHAIEGERESIGADADATADYLRALNDPAPVVRYAGAMVVGELQIKEARGTLLGMIEDKNPFVRVGVRFALHRLGDYTYSHDFEILARDSDPHVRGATAMALGRMGEPSATRILTVLRRDPNPAVRQQASEGLWRLGDMMGAEDLAGLVKSHYRDDQMIAILALASTHDPSIRENIRPEISGIDTDVKLVAARAMAMLGGGPYDIGYPIAMDGTREADPKLRVLAALALGAIGRTDEQPVLKDMLGDKDPDVRIAAAAAILELTPPEKRPAASE